MSHIATDQLQERGINLDRLQVISHPMVDAHMTDIRDKETSNRFFSLLVRNTIAPVLAYEATRRVPTTFHRVVSPTGALFDGVEARESSLLVEIPRAGKAFTDAFMDFLPKIEFGYVNVRRDEATAQAVRGDVKLPDDCDFGSIFVLDPMLATGGSMKLAIESLTKRRAQESNITVVSLVASVAGVAAVHAVSPDIHVITAALDAELNEASYIMPGLGDAGDRLFGKGSAGIATTE